MSQPDRFGVLIAADMPPEQRDELLATLRAYTDLDELNLRPLDPATWNQFVAVMKDVGIVAGGATAAIKLVKESEPYARKAITVLNDRALPAAKRAAAVLAVQLIALRQQIAAQGEQLAATFRRGGDQLDLATASDEEVLDWLLQEPPRNSQ